MRNLRVAVALAAIATAIALPTHPAQAQKGEIRLLASNGIRGVLETIIPEYERKSGQRISAEYAASAVLRRSIEGGAAFDLTILTPPVVDDLIKAGLIAKGTATDVARTDLAVGMKAGAAKSDISTPEALKKRLQAAKSITFNKEGAATATFNEILNKLGLTDALQSRIVLQTVSRRQAESVAEGQNELFFAPLSEVLSVPGVEPLGLFPKEFQVSLVMTAGIGAKAANPSGAKALLQFLLGSEAAPVFKASGMEPIAQ